MAINPAPTQSCCTAGITNLLGAQTQHPGGLIQIAQPLALVGSRGNRPAVNRWAQAAGNGYQPRTDPIVLHRRYR
jgi:hypothetical protein